MIYAIAITEQKLSHKFSQSDSFAFYNEQQELIATCKNPALGLSGCAAKKLIIELLLKMQCDVIIVRKVGEKTLAKLLSAGFKIEQGNTRNSIEQLLNNAALNKNALTKPEQGVQSSCGSKGHGESCCHQH